MARFCASSNLSMSGPIGVAKCGYSIFSQARKMTICNMARTPRNLQLNRPSLDGAPMESARQVPHTTHRTRQQPPYDSRCNDYARLRTGALLGAVRSGCSKNPSFYRPKHLIRRVSTVRSLRLCRKRLSIILVLFCAPQELLSPWAFCRWSCRPAVLGVGCKSFRSVARSGPRARRGCPL